MEISVIIPLFNKAPHIIRAIESVLTQTAPASEIIVIDDGSTDNGSEIVASLASKNPIIKLISQDNKGASFTRNRGVELASSEHVAFLDADDEWKPDYLAQIQRLYINFPDCGAYATSYEVIEENGDKSLPAAAGLPPAPWMGIIPNYFKMLQGGNPFFTSSIVMPKTIFKNLGGFPIGVKRGEDRMLWTLLAVKYPIAYSPSRQVVYRQDAVNRATHIFQPEIKVIQLMDEMIKTEGVPMGLINDFLDYEAYLKIRKASRLIKSGNSNSAMVFLSDAKKNKRYRLKWLWWFLLSKMPFFLIRIFRKLKNKIPSIK